MLASSRFVKLVLADSTITMSAIKKIKLNFQKKILSSFGLFVHLFVATVNLISIWNRTSSVANTLSWAEMKIKDFKPFQDIHIITATG